MKLSEVIKIIKKNSKNFISLLNLQVINTSELQNLAQNWIFFDTNKMFKTIALIFTLLFVIIISSDIVSAQDCKPFGTPVSILLKFK